MAYATQFVFSDSEFELLTTHAHVIKICLSFTYMGIDVMLIYRVEDSNGQGMYHSLWVEATEGIQEDYYHPTPASSERLMQQVKAKSHIKEFSEYYFGFVSIEQFHKWIYEPEWRKTMTELGGVLKVYKVDKRHVCVDEQQAMFIIEKSKLVKVHAIDFFG